MRRTSFESWPCSIARTVDLLGDGWTLLVLREAFYGETRFDGFAGSLSIPRNTLTARLAHLVERGLLHKQPYQSEPTRHDYLLTDMGQDFFGVLAALNAWGDRWLATDAGLPVALGHDTCGHDLHAEVVCRHCRAVVAADDITVRPGPGYPEHLLDRPAVSGRFRPRA